MQCTFCAGASRARCASNRTVAPPYLRPAVLAHAREQQRMRSVAREAHQRMRTRVTRPFFLSLFLAGIRAYESFLARPLLLR